MCGLGVSDFSTELILRCFYETQKMGGNFDINTACKIRAMVEKKHEDLEIPPSITIEDVDGFYNKAVEIFHEKKENDELSSKLILYELKKLIETKRQEFTK